MAEQTMPVGVNPLRAAAISQRRRWWRHLNGDRILSLLLLSPSVIAIAIFVYSFIGYTGFVSLVKWDTFNPDYTFVGLRN